MDIIRRNTDYAFRFLAQLCSVYERGQAISAKVLADENSVPYPVTSKLLQKLAKAGIVKSVMGARGGFSIADDPGRISFLDIITAIQGPISVNKCVMGDFVCPMKGRCPVHCKLKSLQGELEDVLTSMTLAEFVAQRKDG